MKIPKLIHYCWFGGSPLPEEYKRYIETWKTICPDYKIIRWDESNFDVNICQYTKMAYEQKKYAFVSDYARFFIMYNYGGIYLDTDVELIKNLDDLLDMSFMGFEDGKNVASGLIVGGIPNETLFKEIVDFYNDFRDFNTRITVVNIVTDLLLKYNLVQNDSMQIIKNVKIYPTDYFNPLGPNFNDLKITNNTFSIHHYNASWKSKEEKKLHDFRIKYGRKKGKLFFILCHPFLALRVFFR